MHGCHTSIFMDEELRHNPEDINPKFHRRENPVFQKKFQPKNILFHVQEWKFLQ
jgi:hypothetical protein